MEARRELARLVRARRGELKLSVSRAAKLAPVDRATWTGVEDATRVPQSHNRAAIEKVLGWTSGSIDRILAGAGGPQVDEPSPTPTPSRARWQTYRVTAEETLNLLRVAFEMYGDGGFWQAFDDIYFGRENTQRTSRQSPSDQQGQSA
jgi:hypothetical protein